MLAWLASIRRLLGIVSAVGWILIATLYSLGYALLWLLTKLVTVLGPPFAPLLGLSDEIAIIGVVVIVLLTIVLPAIFLPIGLLILAFWAVVNGLRMVGKFAQTLAAYLAEYVLPLLRQFSTYLLVAWIGLSLVIAIALVLRGDRVVAVQTFMRALETAMREVWKWIKERVIDAIFHR